MEHRDRAEAVLGERFGAALAYAVEAHGRQYRKGTGTPYVAHLLGVTSLAIEGASESGILDEDLAIAAVLHDVVEDQGGLRRLADVRARFGDEVARIVEACSDSVSDDAGAKAPWRERKLAYLAHLKTADRRVLTVSLADKLHNARAILLDHRTHGDDLWRRFPDADVPWYYGSLVEIFARRLPGPQAGELARVVGEIRGRAGEAGSTGP